MKNCSYLFDPAILMIDTCLLKFGFAMCYMVELDTGTNLKGSSFRQVDFLSVAQNCLEWSCIVFFSFCSLGARGLL